MFLQISLGNFSGYFGFFAALNLGYATSQQFRDAVDNNILKIKEKTLQDDIQSLKSRIGVITGMAQAASLLREANELEVNFQRDLNNLKNDAETASEFIQGFKSMFLVTTLYSLLVLSLVGFQDPSVPNINYCYYNVINLLGYVVLGFNTFVWMRSRHRRLYRIKIKPFLVTSLFLSFVFAAMLFNHFELARIYSVTYRLESCMILACLASVSPYMIHFCKAYFHRKKFKPVEEKFIDDYTPKVNELHNFVTVSLRLRNLEDKIETS